MQVRDWERCLGAGDSLEVIISRLDPHYRRCRRRVCLSARYRHQRAQTALEGENPLGEIKRMQLCKSVTRAHGLQ